MRSLFKLLAGGGCLVSGTALAHPSQRHRGLGNLVANCGFEIADTNVSGAADWTLSAGTTTPGTQVAGVNYGIDNFIFHTGGGAYLLAPNGQGLGPNSTDVSANLVLSQALALPFSSGNYEVSFFVSQDSPPGGLISSLDVSFGGETGINIPVLNPTGGFIEESFLATDVTALNNLLA